MKLKHEIQDLIDVGKIIVGNHAPNVDHKAFKDPLPTYEQGDSSKSKGGARVNYTYTNNDNVMNMIESSQAKYCNVIIVPDHKNQAQAANAMIHAQRKITLPGANSSTFNQTTSNLPNRQIDTIMAKSKQLASSSSPGYSIVEQLKRTNAQISILELLKISSAHREVLDKALLTNNVPKDLDVDWFQSMVRHLTSPHYLTFSREDDNSLSQPHNQPLHIKAMIHKNRVKCVLIDGGTGLNICTYNLLTQLGFSANVIDPTKKITIKAYDEEERTSKGPGSSPFIQHLTR